MSALRFLGYAAAVAVGGGLVYTLAKKNLKDAAKSACTQVKIGDLPVTMEDIMDRRQELIPEGYRQPITIELTEDGYPIDCRRLIETLSKIGAVGTGQVMGATWFAGLFSVWGYDRHGAFGRIVVVTDKQLCEISMTSDQYGRLNWSADNDGHPLKYEMLGQDILADLITDGQVTVNGQIYHLADHYFDPARQSEHIVEKTPPEEERPVEPEQTHPAPKVAPKNNTTTGKTGTGKKTRPKPAGDTPPK